MERPWEFQGLEAVRLQDSLHMKMVRLSAISTGRFYLQGETAGTHFCYRVSRPQGHNSARNIMSLQSPTELIRNWSRYIYIVMSKTFTLQGTQNLNICPPKLNNYTKYKPSWEAKSRLNDQ